MICSHIWELQKRHSWLIYFFVGIARLQVSYRTKQRLPIGPRCCRRHSSSSFLHTFRQFRMVWSLFGFHNAFKSKFLCVLFWWRDEIHKVSGEGKWNIRKVFIPKFDKAGHFVLWQNPRDVFFCFNFVVEFKASIEKWLYEWRKTFKITEMLPFSATEYFRNNFNKL